jgi:hypothetical protein
MKLNSDMQKLASFQKSSMALIAGFCMIVCLSVFLASCTEDPPSGVDREKLFTLSFGRFEDELDLFNLDSNETGPDSQIFMKDGMFYIANSGSQKILQLTSFGDLLSVYYDPDSNPVPSFASASGANAEAADASASPGATTTRKAVPYPLRHPTYLSVDSRKKLYVVDRVPEERYEYDSEAGVVLKEVVLAFAPDGRFTDYLGQEGPGGTPFPPVTGLFSTAKNETVVVTKSQAGVKIFWFGPEGYLLYRIPVSFRNLPSPYDKGDSVYATLEKIIPDQSSPRLYLKIDYYATVIDTATGSNAGIAFDKSCLYPLDLETGSYSERIELPVYSGVDSTSLGTETFNKPYELLGVSSSGWIFLTTPIDQGYMLEILDSKSRRILKRVLRVHSDELAYNALTVSPEGIISALLATNYEASVVWWRTDSLIGEIRR